MAETDLAGVSAEDGAASRVRGRVLFHVALATSFAFMLFALLVLERLGLPQVLISLAIISVSLIVFVVASLVAATMRLTDYFVAARQLPSLHNGMAMASDWISGSLFLGLAAVLYTQGASATPYVVASCAGLVLMAVLFAPYLNRSGALTLPDFLTTRFSHRAVGGIAMAVIVATALPLLAAQFILTGFIAANFLPLARETAIVGTASLAVIIALLGGMRALTWSQIAQYILIAVAFLLPLAVLSMGSDGQPVPQFALATVLSEIGRIVGSDGPAAGATAAQGGFDLPIMLCLILASASLPHILTRFLAAASPSQARRSAAWGLGFVVPIVTAAPLFAAFVTLEILLGIDGASIDMVPDWVIELGSKGLFTICGAPAISAEAIAQACGDGTITQTTLAMSDVSLDPRAVVLGLPAIAGMSMTLEALLAAGAVAATLSSAASLLLTVANTLCHDGFHKLLAPRAPAAARLFMARILLIPIAALTAYVAQQAVQANALPANLLPAFWALAIAASGLFPVLVGAIWWKRTNMSGAVAAMFCGVTVAIVVLATGGAVDLPFADAGMLPLPGRTVPAILFGLLAGVCALVAGSLVTSPPSQEARDFVTMIRGGTKPPTARDRAV
ncbi:VC_2705 family sodium/solute symporter [Breoghania sp.]|uniref:VC_2705 family sodium/solute symporter n=1 Tax=Breoghania sp. TaxID=2065378 RepID=UPI002AAAB13C|nr:VC_2705 family sodium/solute symporter [Breoghania sp.]